MSRSRVQTLVLLTVTAGGLYVCYRVAAPFVPWLVWALALAVVFTPLQRWLESKLKRPNLAAGISILVIAVVVLGLATLVGERLIDQAGKGAELIREKVESGEWRRALEAQPRLAGAVHWIEEKVDLRGTVNAGAAWMTTRGGSIVKGSVVQVIGVLLTFYLLFFFLRDRHAALDGLRSLSPLSEVEMARLFARVGDTIFATVYGTLAVAAVQGLLGGLMFWWLGLSAPLLWGLVMGLLAVLPVLGAFVVWIPAAVVLLVEGSWVKALILTLWGMLVVGSVDNFLRPVLVGKRLQQHTILAFISLVGGLIVFGAAGLILGPVALTFTIVLLEIWRERFAATRRAEISRLIQRPAGAEPPSP